MSGHECRELSPVFSAGTARGTVSRSLLEVVSVYRPASPSTAVLTVATPVDPPTPALAPRDPAWLQLATVVSPGSYLTGRLGSPMKL